VKIQNREGQRQGEIRTGADNRSDIDMSVATPFKIWDAIMQFHPYKNEILNVAKFMKSVGANSIIISATLSLQGWGFFSEVVAGRKMMLRVY